MSVRAQLEAKQRRKLDVPVLISDPSADQEALLQVVAALGMARSRNESVQELERQQEESAARLEAHWVRVPLQQLPPAEWEAITATCQTEAGTDWSKALPPLLAASCLDEELKDEAWWAGMLDGGTWSVGEINTLKLALLRLNVEAADPLVPKG